MAPLLKQLKARRKALGLRQQDMEQRVGMSRQQYQRLESRGNPRLDTLALIAKGVNSELMLIPRDKLVRVQAVLEGKSVAPESAADSVSSVRDAPSEDPWADILEDT